MLPVSTPLDCALIRDAGRGCWLFFQGPLQVLVARRAEEVLPVLQQLDAALDHPGCYAAGWVAYEAAPAFDPALLVRPAPAFPLAWFGLYREPQVIPALPAVPADRPGAHFSTWTASISPAAYTAAIDRIKDHIARGETYQVNFTYRLTSTFAGDPLALFFDLARAQNAPYAAFIHTGLFSICSASPELFFELDGDRITSKPMKGTAPRGRTQLEDQEQATWLRNSAKDQAENVMIVDMVRNDIGKIAHTGSVQVHDLYAVEKYPTVWQMVTTVTGKTFHGYVDIFRALFPPASITGAPKARTMQIIAGLETSPRRIYTGCIGYMQPGRRAQFNVAIRTVLIEHATSRAEYGTGGGITWGSTDAAEFEESKAKARILSVRMPEFSLLETLLWTPSGGYFLIDQHLRRLAGSAAYFDFPLDPQEVRRYLANLAAAFGRGAQKIRLLVDQHGQMTSQVEPLRQHEPQKVLRLCIAPNPIDLADPFLYHKTTQRLVYEQALKACAGAPGAPWDDVLLWNVHGEVTESCTANVVVERDGEFYTPPLSCGLLAGTYRAWLLEQGRLKEAVIRLQDLHNYRHFYLINSVRKQRVAQLAQPEGSG